MYKTISNWINIGLNELTTKTQTISISFFSWLIEINVNYKQHFNEVFLIVDFLACWRSKGPILKSCYIVTGGKVYTWIEQKSKVLYCINFFKWTSVIWQQRAGVCFTLLIKVIDTIWKGYKILICNKEAEKLRKVLFPDYFFQILYY